MHQRKVAVIGLGYVGLPVAVELGKVGPVIGFDINKTRIEELKKGIDRTREVSDEEFRGAQVYYTAAKEDLKGADFFIVTVPTPVDNANNPDLSLVFKASQTVGEALSKGAIVVYESTVYPGATEEECVPILAKASGLRNPEDFTVGLSPERINPGDKTHRFTKIKKVVSGQDAKTLDIVCEVYGSVVEAGLYRAASIKVAEAAKVIENTQRDLNIALVNELAVIFDKMGIDTNDVLDAAATKWNFLNFRPGLVGGHCIGVDPYYLTHKAETLGYIPQVILAGRKLNSELGTHIAERAIKTAILAGQKINGAHAIVLGITFKENVPDLRNTRVVDIVRTLQSYGMNVQVTDPLAQPEDALHEYGIELIDFEKLQPASIVVFAVSHEAYVAMPDGHLDKIARPGAAIIDVKGMLDRNDLTSRGYAVWRL